MKYYSEVTNKLYNTTEALKYAEQTYYDKVEAEERKRTAEKERAKAEKAAKELAERKKEEERKGRYDEAVHAFDAAYDAYTKARELGRKYAEDFGSFNYKRVDTDEDGKKGEETSGELHFKDVFDLIDKLFCVEWDF